MKQIPERYRPNGRGVDYRVDSARKPGHDYAAAGWYFITICTYERYPYFKTQQVVQPSKKLSALTALKDYHAELPLAGKNVIEEWERLTDFYPASHFESIVVMPDHIHLLLYLFPENTTPLGQIVGGFKGACSRRIRDHLSDFQWQTRFYDRIIRTEQELEKAKNYIWQNPFLPKDKL